MAGPLKCDVQILVANSSFRRRLLFIILQRVRSAQGQSISLPTNIDGPVHVQRPRSPVARERCAASWRNVRHTGQGMHLEDTLSTTRMRRLNFNGFGFGTCLPYLYLCLFVLSDFCARNWLRTLCSAARPTMSCSMQATKCAERDRIAPSSAPGCMNDQGQLSVPH